MRDRRWLNSNASFSRSCRASNALCRASKASCRRLGSLSSLRSSSNGTRSSARTQSEREGQHRTMRPSHGARRRHPPSARNSDGENRLHSSASGRAVLQAKELSPVKSNHWGAHRITFSHFCSPNFLGTLEPCNCCPQQPHIGGRTNANEATREVSSLSDPELCRWDGGRVMTITHVSACG